MLLEGFMKPRPFCIEMWFLPSTDRSAWGVAYHDVISRIEWAALWANPTSSLYKAYLQQAMNSSREKRLIRLAVNKSWVTEVWLVSEYGEDGWLPNLSKLYPVSIETVLEYAGLRYSSCYATNSAIHCCIWKPGSQIRKHESFMAYCICVFFLGFGSVPCGAADWLLPWTDQHHVAKFWHRVDTCGRASPTQNSPRSPQRHRYAENARCMCYMRHEEMEKGKECAEDARRNDAM